MEFFLAKTNHKMLKAKNILKPKNIKCLILKLSYVMIVAILMYILNLAYVSKFVLEIKGRGRNA